MLTCPRSSLSFHSNAHHHGSLPQQLGMVWDLLLKADPEGPSPIFHAALRHRFHTHTGARLYMCLCSTLWSRTSMSTWPSPSSEQLGTPDPPAIRFTRGPSFGASWFTHLLRPVRLLALLYGSDRSARPPRAFPSRLPTDRSPSPLLGITTTAT